MTSLRFLDLFSGIGGFSLGLERAGRRTVAFCEIDPFCKRVLKKHWPLIKCYGDIRKLTAARLQADGVEIDAICGGFPCQDISIAGKGAGIDGEHSGLWSEYKRLVDELRPRYVIVENVPALLHRGIERVLGDLAAIRYDAEWRCISASDVGAPHERDRVWIIAYPGGTRRQGLVAGKDISQSGSWGLCSQEDLLSVIDAPFKRGDRWPQPLLRRMDDGLPGRLDRLRAIGNAVVPQITEAIGRTLL